MTGPDTAHEIAAKAPRWQQKPGKAPAGAPDETLGGGPDNVIRCARCGNEVTKAACRIRVHDLHEHSQVNPHGYIWQFGCFSAAPGVRPVGVPSDEFSWFAGASWQIVHCASCDLHLGWRFSFPDQAFFGLIVDRVYEGPP